MATFFETPEAANIRTEKTTKMITSNQRNTRTHTGNLNNYTFEKEKFQKHITTLPAGSKVSWRCLAIKFNLKNKNGVRPSNGGQILLSYAKKIRCECKQI